MSSVKIILPHLLVVAAIGAAGLGVCQVLHLHAHGREILMAGLITVAAAELAMIPVFIVRNRPADNVVQGALVSTLVHILVAAGAGLGVQQLTHPPQAFLQWLCVFYWATLATVCSVLVRVVKSAPVPVVR